MIPDLIRYEERAMIVYDHFQLKDLNNRFKDGWEFVSSTQLGTDACLVIIRKPKGD